MWVVSRTESLALPTISRISNALRQLDVAFFQNENEELMVLYEKGAVLLMVEGRGDILVIRGRLHAMIDPNFTQLVWGAINEWNRKHRFMKAYIENPELSEQLPVYAEIQTSLYSGISDSQLLELSVFNSFTTWIHDESMVL